jgi:hypothetical protein
LLIGITFVPACHKAKDAEPENTTTAEKTEPAKKAYINSVSISDSTLIPNEHTEISVGVYNPDEKELSLEAKPNRGTITPQKSNVIGSEVIFMYKADDIFFKDKGTYTISIGLILYQEKTRLDTTTATLYVVVDEAGTAQIKRVTLE